MAKSAALLQLAYAKCCIITSHGGSTFHFYPYTERAKRVSSVVALTSLAQQLVFITAFAHLLRLQRASLSCNY